MLTDRTQLLRVAESALVLETGETWGRLKNGAGTPPVRIDEGWFSLFHGVDPQYDASGTGTGMRYSAGIVIHDAERPDRILYRSPEPAFAPMTPDELRGMVHNVVFPTAIDVRPGADARDYDVYYGMADSRIGRVRVQLGASEREADGAGRDRGVARAALLRICERDRRDRTRRVARVAPLRGDAAARTAGRATAREFRTERPGAVGALRGAGVLSPDRELRRCARVRAAARSVGRPANRRRNATARRRLRSAHRSRLGDARSRR